MPTRPLVTSYEQDLRLFPDAWHRVGMIAAAAIVLAYPFLADARWLMVGNMALVAIVGAVGMMVLTGFAGQISLGHAAFLALGAYTAAVLATRWHLPFWLLLPLAGVVPAALGLVVGTFALRLKGLYLAIVTVGLVFLVNHILLSMPSLTRGLSGISVPMYLWFGADNASFGETWRLGALELTFERKMFFAYVLVVLVVMAVAGNLARSRSGRAMMAVRDHDLAAAALGVPPARTKIIAFTLSSYLAGVAGAMFAFQQQYITVEPPFDLLMSVQYIAMIVLGGMGTVFGAVAGAIAFTLLSPAAEEVARHLPLLTRLSSAQQATVLFSLVVCALLVVEPLGIFGLWLRVKRYFLAWPFRY